MTDDPTRELGSGRGRATRELEPATQTVPGPTYVLEPRSSGVGRRIFWFTVVPLEPADEGTDRWAVEHDFVSITPLRLDLTDEQGLAKALTRHPT